MGKFRLKKGERHESTDKIDVRHFIIYRCRIYEMRREAGKEDAGAAIHGRRDRQRQFRYHISLSAG